MSDDIPPLCPTELRKKFGFLIIRNGAKARCGQFFFPNKFTAQKKTTLSRVVCKAV